MSKPESVLIVEDEAIIALDLAQLIEDMGFSPVVAATVSDALVISQSRDIDFAILDYRVGEFTTDELAQTLREKRVPFALCSGSRLGLAEPAFEGVPLIPKPYTIDLIRAVIQSVLS